MTKRIVITGIDTGIGKTVFSAGLAGLLDGFYGNGEVDEARKVANETMKMIWAPKYPDRFFLANRTWLIGTYSSSKPDYHESQAREDTRERSLSELDTNCPAPFGSEMSLDPRPSPTETCICLPQASAFPSIATQPPGHYLSRAQMESIYRR